MSTPVAVTDELQTRVERLEREVRRWRIALVSLIAILSLNSLIGPAHAADRFLALMGLTADTVDTTDLKAVKIRATEVVAERLTLRDSSGKIRGTLGMGSISDDVSLELRTPDGTRSASLRLDREDARLTLWAGLGKPTASLWASTGQLMPAGLFVASGGKETANLELIGKDLEPALTMADAKGNERVVLGLDGSRAGLKLTDEEKNLRVRISADQGAGAAGFYSRFGSIELDKNQSTYATPEPAVRIRGAQGSGAEVRLGMENAEPFVEIKDSVGNTAWTPKLAKPEVPKKQMKKDPSNPL